MNYFRRKWNINSKAQLLLILVVFAATGFSFLYVKTWVFKWIGYEQITWQWLRIVVYILVGYPLYNALLLLIGHLSGQGLFFRRFIRNMNLRLIGKKPQA